MNYVTTNIRLPEEDYLQLKEEAAKKRKSLAAVIREKIAIEHKRYETEIESFLRQRDQLAKKLKKKLQGFDVVKALREMRYKGKW